MAKQENEVPAPTETSTSTPTEPVFPTYEGDVLGEEVEHVVSTPTGEVAFKTTSQGTFTPTNDEERLAVELLGATPKGA